MRFYKGCVIDNLIVKVIYGNIERKDFECRLYYIFYYFWGLVLVCLIEIWGRIDKKRVKNVF